MTCSPSVATILESLQPAKVSNRIRKIWPDVLLMRRELLTFRQIAEILGEHYKIKIDPRHLASVVGRISKKPPMAGANPVETKMPAAQDGRAKLRALDAKAHEAVPLIENRILLVRGQKVMLDTELAELYGVPTGRLNEAVKRNRVRFPEDFMFQLTRQEARELEALRSQNATLKRGQRRKYAPFVFTEHGIAMLSSVLNSERAIVVNIAIVRTFVRLRQMLATHEELAQRLELLEWRQDEQAARTQGKLNGAVVDRSEIAAAKRLAHQVKDEATHGA
jgi:phage regulator Rha-like protein